CGSASRTTARAPDGAPLGGLLPGHDQSTARMSTRRWWQNLHRSPSPPCRRRKAAHPIRITNGESSGPLAVKAPSPVARTGDSFRDLNLIGAHVGADREDCRAEVVGFQDAVVTRVAN